MILMIDNYDSFTFNLVQALEAAGAEVRVLRNDAIDRAGIEALAADPAANLRGIVVSPGPGDPDSAGVSMDAVRVAVERRIPTPGRLPRHAGDGPGLRRHDPARPHARPRRGVDHPPRPEGAAGRDALPVHGGALPLSVRRAGDAAGRAGGHGPDRRGRRGHGHPAPSRPGRGRAVPSGIGSHARGPASAGQLPAARRRGRGNPARSGLGDVRAVRVRQPGRICGRAGTASAAGEPAGEAAQAAAESVAAVAGRAEAVR